MKETRQGGLSRKIGCTVSLLFVLGIILCLVVMLSARVDHYKFLGGRRPIFGGVASGYSHGPSLGHDYSTYSWEENYRDVLTKAKRELVSIGFVVGREDTTGVVWHKGRDVYIEIMPGRSHNKNDFWGPDQPNENWVTVQIIMPGADTWATHLRYTLERDHAPGSD